MSVNPSNLLMGPVSILVANFGATEPVDAVVAPGAGWTDPGGTTDGATLNFGQTYTPLKVDQIGMDAGAQVTAQEVTVSTNLAEVTLDNLRLAINQAAAPTVDEMEFGGEDITNVDPLYRAIMLRGRKPGTAIPRMWIVRRTLSTEGIGVPFKKDGQTMYPITWRGYYVSASVRAVRVSEKPAAG